MIGAEGKPYLEAGQWQMNLGFRYQYSDRHFVGHDHRSNRDREGSNVRNYIYLFDIGFTYGIDDRDSVSFSIPYLIARRSSQYEIDAAGNHDRRWQSAQGVGDFTATLRRWMFDPKENPDGNIQLGFGIKLPTGSPDEEDARPSFNPDTGEVENEVRTVDQSIQPGDGGFGFLIDLSSFYRMGSFTPYLAGVYLFNPEETNHVRTYRGGAGEAEMSIPDAYLLRVGTLFGDAALGPFTLGLGARWEGTPVNDLIGGSNDFRRPGYAISAEPQVYYTSPSGNDTLSLAVPIALDRTRQQSNPDRDNDRHGDAAFADWMLLLGWTHKF
ncbi:MAG: hypothetical protein U1E76_25890 [Planctomycetota bacterium]